MTKKHFIKIAAAIGLQVEQWAEGTEGHDTLRELADDLCDIFKRINPRFDKDRFMAACGF